MGHTMVRGTRYILATRCQYCTEVQAAYLGTLQQTLDDRTQRRMRCLFQCCGCHASRLICFRDTGPTAAPSTP